MAVLSEPPGGSGGQTDRRTDGFSSSKPVPGEAPGLWGAPRRRGPSWGARAGFLATVWLSCIRGSKGLSNGSGGKGDPEVLSQPCR